MPQCRTRVCHRTSARVTALACLSWLGSSAAPAAAPPGASTAALHYRVTDLGTLPGADSSQAYGIDAEGRVVGCASRQYIYAFIPLRPLLWDHGHKRDLGLLPGYREGGAVALGPHGEVVGMVSDVTNPTGCRKRAALWRGGTLTDLGLLPGHSDSQATSVNAHRVVAGYASDGGSATMAFLWRDGRMRRLGTLRGFRWSVAEAVNGRGQVAGSAVGTRASESAEEATLYSHGRLLGLGRLGGDYSHAYGLSASGRVVGATDVGRLDVHGNRITHPFLWERGHGMRDLGTLGGTYGEAHAINGHGLVVGDCTRPDGHEHAFLWEHARLHDLNDLIPPGAGWVLAEANAINDRGEIAGVGVIGEHEHAVLLTPQGRANQ